MDKEELKKIAANPHFISGIYNYCDRWCERCPQTSRCLVYALSSEPGADLEDRDLETRVFWERLYAVLNMTKELLEEAAGRAGLSIDSLQCETRGDDGAVDVHRLERDGICDAASSYAQMVDEWFDSTIQIDESRGSETSLDLSQIGSRAGDADALAVIRWYQHLIYVKLKRAIQGAEEVPETPDDLPSDPDCSAKVALIGIDRSIAAWTELRRQTPSGQDQLLDVLVHLDRLRRSVETAFPRARATRRPGFDDLDGLGEQ